MYYRSGSASFGLRMVHNLLYTKEEGVGLGFVIFYMRYIIISITFLATSIKPKHSSVIFGLVIIFMLYSWYGTNPLRVILMFCSSLSGCSIIIFAKKSLKET